MQQHESLHVNSPKPSRHEFLATAEPWRLRQRWRA